MEVVVELKFGANSKGFLYDAKNFNELKRGDKVVANFSDSKDFGVVVSVVKNLEITTQLGEILRVATKQDELDYKKVLEQSKTSFKKVQEAVLKFELPMKLVEVRHSLDKTKLFISYSAESRVDFRELVKYLASIFKTRVELRQISSREEAKMLGGCGSCGRPFCCSTFLSDNSQVTIKMAKTQGLALNPSKINGACGKLLCCIAFEHPEYQQILEKMPQLGSKVRTPEGEGEVVFQDLIKEKVSVKIFEDEQNYKVLDFDLSSIEV